MRGRVRAVDVFVVLCGLSLAVAGNLLGNLVTDNVPARWSQYALPLLVPAIIAALIVSLLLGRVRSGTSRRDPRNRSRVRRRVTTGLIALDELLAACIGILSNAASSNLPRTLEPYALPLFALVTGCVIVLAVAASRITATRVREVSTRAQIVPLLQGEYNARTDKTASGVGYISLPPQAGDRPVDAGQLTPQGAGRAEPGAVAERNNTAAVVRVYDAAGGHLLVVGGAGAGKSTLLAELAKALLKRALAAKNVAHPGENTGLPVIFDLSTWAVDRLPLDEWMVEELRVKYNVRPSTARTWVATGDVIPLLDGFDEVPRALRYECAKKIDEFYERQKARRTQESPPLVVCSRQDAVAETNGEYAKAAANELSSNPVFSAPARQPDSRAGTRAQRTWSQGFKERFDIPPLRDADILAYLKRGDDEFAPLARAVEHDDALRDMLRSPLILRLVTLTYRNLPETKIPRAGEVEVWRRQLFHDYVAETLRPKHHGDADEPSSEAEVPYDQPYEEADAERYLAWLAWNMRASGMIDFHSDAVQPGWLPDARAFDRYRVGTTVAYGLIAGATIGLTYALIHAMGPGADPQLATTSASLVGLQRWVGPGGALALAGLVAGLGCGLIDAIFIGLAFRLTRGAIKPVYQALGEPSTLPPERGGIDRWSLTGALFGVARGALIYALAFGFVFGPHGAIVAGTTAGVADGLLGGVVFGVAGRNLAYIQPRLWSWSVAGAAAALGIVIYLVMSLSLGMAFLVLGGLGGLPAGGVIVALGCGLIAGLARGVDDARSHGRSAWGITRLAARALANGLVGGVVMGSLVGLTVTLLLGPTSASTLGIAAGLSGALVIGLRSGGLFALQRFALTRGLLRTRVMPPDLPRFLDYAAERYLLRRVGNGYRFSHALLRDYFAAMR
jgi:hypothetical protein